MYQNPFQDMSVDKAYKGLVNGDFGPRWPNEQLQAGYTGISGPGLLSRAFEFIKILEHDGAFKPEWKGLDYGCGWGRFLSALLSKGSAEQLDGCDAWQKTLNIIAEMNYRNNIFKVSELLREDQVAARTYDFIMAFSVFTHLSPAALEQNIPVLLSGLKENGNLYITVRHAEFIDHKLDDQSQSAEFHAILDNDGAVFLEGGDLTGEKIFGNTIITNEYLTSRFENVRYLGQSPGLQHIYAISHNPMKV